MPRLTVYGRGREKVWEGEAEVYLTQNTAWDRTDVTIERRSGDYYQRIPLTQLFQYDLVSWQVSAPVARLRIEPDVSFDQDVPMVVAEIETQWELMVELPAGCLDALKRLLDEEPMPPEERERRGELRHRAMRSLDRDHIDQAFHAGALREGEYETLIRQSLCMHGVTRPGDALREFIRNDMQDMRERMRRAGEAFEQVRSALGSVSAGELMQALGYEPDRTVIEESGEAIDTAVHRSAEHDRIIEEARASFPADPWRYDYPQSNEMRWSPPPEGEEVRSCPA